MRHFNIKRWAFAALLTVFALCSSNYLHAGDITHDINTDGSLTILASSSDNYIIKGATTTNKVLVKSGYKGTITMQDLSITIASGSVSPFYIEGKDNQSNWEPVTVVDIILEGENFLGFYGSYAAALQVDQGAQIKISAIDPKNNASGKLTAKANSYTPGTSISGGGAGIGSSINGGSRGTSVIKNSDGSVRTASGTTAGGNIIITSGTIIAYGSHGAGIGGGYTTWYNGIIIITGGVIEARAGYDSAGIGSGCPEGTGVLRAYADKSAIIALPPCEITAYGAGYTSAGGVGVTQFAELGLNGTNFLTYVNDPAKPIVTIRTEDNERNADIYLDLTETPGLQNIFDNVYSDFDLTHVWIGKTAVADGLMKVHGLFQDPTTFFTDASSSASATFGRPYMPVSTTTSGAETIILPLFEAEISFTDYASVALTEGYSTTQAKDNAYCLKLEYNDAFPLTGLTYKLQGEASSNFKNLIFLDSDSLKQVSAPTTLNNGDVYYIVVPLKDGKPVGSYTDVILIHGTFKDVVMAGYIRKISDQLVVKDDTETNSYIKVTANPATFTVNHPTSETVNLTLNITHAGISGVPYDASKVTAKYIVTTEQNYDAAVAATPINQWTDLTIPAADGGNAVTTVSFAGTAAGTYYIHWYVVSGVVMAHSKDVTDPARNYGGFGQYNIIAGKAVTYNGNGSDDGGVPVDATKYPPLDSVTVIGNTGTLTRVGATFIGWSFNVSDIVTAATGEPADLLVAGQKFEIVTDTTLYAVWAEDENGSDGDSDDVPDYKQFGVAYDGNGSTEGEAPTDENLYSSGYGVTAKAKGELAKTNGATAIVFAGWTPEAITDVLTFATAGDTTELFVREGGVFTITDHTTMYAVWSTDINGNNTPDIFETGYNVTYDANGAIGTGPSDGTDYLTGMGATVQDKGELVKDDAVFLGWSRSAVGVITTAADELATDIIAVDSILVIYADTELYAVWAEDENGPEGESDEIPDYLQFAVTYDGNGSTDGTAPTDANLYSDGDNVIAELHGDLAKTDDAIPAPIVFAGWTQRTPITDVLTYASAGDTTVLFIREGATFPITGATTLYAVWSTDENNNGTPDIFETGYKVTYNANGASGDVPVDDTDYLTGMGAIVQDKGDLAKDDAVFLGWSRSAVSVITTAADELATDIIAVDSVLVISGNITLYAVWAEDENGPEGDSDEIPDYLQFTVTYDGNGSTGGTAPTDANLYSDGDNVIAELHGDLAKTSATIPAPIVFAGWTQRAAINEVLTYASAGDTALYVFIREGAEFTISGATTLYAVWSTDENNNGTPDIFETGYRVTYDGNDATGGTAPVDGTTYLTGMGATVQNKGNLAKSDAVFLGWSRSAVGVITTAADELATDIIAVDSVLEINGSSIVLYAVWAIDATGPDGESDEVPDYDQFAVTYDGNGKTDGSVPTDGNRYDAGNTVIAKDRNGLERTDCVFAGWTPTPISTVLTYASAGDTTEFFVREGGTFTITGNTTLYAVWSTDANGNEIPDIFEPGYNVTYDGNGETAGAVPTDATTYLTGMSVTAPGKGTLAKASGANVIVFAGWTPEPVFNVLTLASAVDTTEFFVREGGTFTITGNTTMYAVWSTDNNGNGTPDIFEAGYHVTYNDNGATSGAAPVDGATYLTGTSFIAKDKGNLVKTGYMFLGWSESPVGIVASATDESAAAITLAGTELSISGNITLYAVWTADANGPDGVSDNVPDYLQFGVTYNGNGETSGTGSVADNNIYSSGTTVTLKAKGNLAKTDCMFLGWNTSAVSVITTLAGEEALESSMKQPDGTFAITRDTVWHAVWAEDVGGNGIPDYKETYIAYNRGLLLPTVGTPTFPTQTVAISSTVTVSNMGINVSGYTIIGWHTNPMPVVSNSTIETAVKTAATFYEIGGSFIAPATPKTTMNLYAVWAVDANNNGKADYAETIYEQTSNRVGARSGMSTQDDGGISLRSGTQDGDGISLRSGEVPGYWNADFDNAALNDLVYYAGCTYNADYDNLLRENLITLNGAYCFDTLIVKPVIPMDFVIKYEGVLADRSMIGGREQRPLDTVRITQAMVDRGFTVSELITYYPFMFNSIKEDGQAILKMYFVKAGTNENPLIGDFRKEDNTPLSASWLKPFLDPETDAFTDTLVIRFNIYNKPEFESEVISQHIDTRGNMRLDQVGGTPLKYMMRSINGLSWQPATTPLTDMEQFVVGDDVSICLREMDKTIADQNRRKAFYSSDDFNKTNPNTNIGFKAWWELYFKRTAELSNNLWEDCMAHSLWDTPGLFIGIKATYDYYIGLGIPEDDAKAGCIMIFEYDVWGPGGMSVYIDSEATLYADENMHAYGLELAESIFIPDPCREVKCLAFEKIVIPNVQRYVEINTITGVTANPAAGMKHYVKAHDDFTFTLSFPGGEPLKVTATGFYSQRPEEMEGTELGGGTFRYVIRRLAEPWTVTVSPDPASGFVDNEITADGRVWTYASTLYISSDKAARANIYTLSGTLLKQLNVTAGTTSAQLERGLYVVEIDGTRYKVVVK